MSMAYRVGRAVGRRPWWFAAAAAFLVGPFVLVGLVNRDEGSTVKPAPAVPQSLSAGQLADLWRIANDKSLSGRERQGALTKLDVARSIPETSPTFELWRDIRQRVADQDRKEADERAARERAQAAALKAEKKKAGVSIGMSRQDVLDSAWGKPSHINRSDYTNFSTEQWVYGNGHYLYFDNDKLTAISTRR